MYCENCGNKIYNDAVICPSCGKQLKELQTEKSVYNPQVIINNNVNNIDRKECDKWIAFLLCLFLGVFGFHKFYEGKIGAGILYIFTCGLLGIGWLIDLIIILCKKNPYYV